MDQLTCDLLTNWGLTDYINSFVDGRIDAGTLRLLGNEEISQLIPIPGHRAKFKANLENWKVELEGLRSSSLDLVNTTADQPTLSCSDSETSFLLDLPLYQTPPSPVQATSKPENLPSTNNSEDNRTSTPVEPHNRTSGYVLQTLQSSHDGKAIFNKGRATGRLDDTQRNLLVKLIIGPVFEKDPNVVITNSQLLNWALEIQELFPSESAALYYTPYVAPLVRGTARNASGKLLRYVYNRRRALREKGIIEGSNRSRSSSSSSNKILQSKTPAVLLEENTDLEEVADKLQFLKNSLEPWHLIEEYWTATANYRLNKIYSGPDTLQEYFNEYPVLKQPAGYTLLLQDFGILYKDKCDALFINIVNLNSKITELARKKAAGIRDRESKQNLEKYLTAVTETTSNETHSDVSLLLLPYLTSSIPLRDKKKTTWKPSKTEVRDGFITQIGSDADLETTIASRRTKLQRFGKSMQPFVIFVGSVTDITHCYVIAGSTYYYFKKLLTAVDACFKIIHATGAKYQEESFVVWMVIQKGFYRIHTVHDKELTTVNSLLVDLEIALK